MFRLVWSSTFKRSPKEEFKLMQKQLKLFKDCGAPCMVFAEVTDSIQGDPEEPHYQKDLYYQKMIGKNLLIP